MTGGTAGPSAEASTRQRRWSRTGLSLCVLYFGFTCACLVMSFEGRWDVKSRFLFLQLPIVFQSAAAFSLGLYPSINRFPTWIPYGLMLLGGFGVCYGVGCVLGGAGSSWRRSRRRFR